MVRIVSFFFAGGDAFFAGLALLAIGMVLAARRRGRSSFPLATVIAWIVIACSGTPLPLWFYGVGGLATAALFRQTRSQTPEYALRRARFAAPLGIVWCLTAATWELSYRFPPRLDASAKRNALVVIGDSISAGMLGPSEQTWPKQFRDRYSVQVVDLSQAGATAESAIQQAERLDAEHPKLDAVVLVEIGGNDYFESKPPPSFAASLDRLLTLLVQSKRQVVMLELPLPPFYNAYGRVQRAMAAKHRVAMISKRAFASVVFSPGATLDTVHLSTHGHGLMADMIWRHLGMLLVPRSADAVRIRLPG